MKKVFTILVIACALAACDSIKSKEAAKDSTAAAAPAVDSSHKVSTTKSGGDTSFETPVSDRPKKWINPPASKAMAKEKTLADGDNVNRTPSSIETSSKGVVLIYCPIKMIEKTPAVITATITTTDLKNAVLQSFMAKKEKEENKTPGQVSKNIDISSIEKYARMRIRLIYDRDYFTLLDSTDDGAMLAFTNQKDSLLEWNWTIKPVKSIENTLLTFRIEGIGQDNKVIASSSQSRTVFVGIDPRNFIRKMADFFGSDIKYTLTAILIPFFTFIGGLITGRRTKKNG